MINQCKFSFLLFFILIANANAQHKQKAISPVDQILKNIKAPEFKKDTFNIVSYGAIADGKTDTKAIFDKVISLCSVSGGGEVIVPKGKFYIAGPVVLKSHVNLHFNDGAELIFSGEPKDYLPAVLTLIFKSVKSVNLRFPQNALGVVADTGPGLRPEGV